MLDELPMTQRLLKTNPGLLETYLQGLYLEGLFRTKIGKVGKLLTKEQQEIYGKLHPIEKRNNDLNIELTNILVGEGVNEQN